MDVVEFLKEVFHGREKVSKRDLFGFAAIHVIAKSSIQKALKQLGYRSRRKGHGWGAKWFIINPDRDWKEQLPVFPSAELEAAGDAQPNPRDTAAAKIGWINRAEYIEDL